VIGLLAVHTADVHLGITNYAPVNPATGLSRRIDDFFSAFDQVIDYAIGNKADLFFLCGDTFKDPSATPTLLKMFATRLRKLSEEGIKTVIILGNHDAPKSGRAAPPEPFIELNVPNVFFFSKPDFLDLECRSGGKARIFAIPFRHPVKMASDRKKGKTELDKDLLAQTFREEISRELEIFTRAGRKGADAVFLAGHLSVEGALAGSERMWATGEEYSVLPSAFDSEVFDYIALGHIHKHQAIKFKTPIVYPGSIERIDLGEADEEKGFVSVRVTKGTANWKFVKLSIRPMYNVKVDCTTVANPVEAVSEAVAGKETKDAIFNLEVTVKDPLSAEQRGAVAQKLTGTFWQQIIYRRQPTEKRATIGAFGTTLEPTQALSKYLKAVKITEKERNLATKMGQQIIDETLENAEA
jgi:exonuclease SbcD